MVDPQRDIDRVLDLAADEDVRISHVFETHIHNDYVTGGLALAERTGAAYFVNAADEVAYDRTPISDNQDVPVGTSMVVRALATPGHTFSHLSYALTAGGEPVAVFTGGSLLYGATGRPDLLGQEHTHDLVHAQYASAHRLAAELPDATEVFPTHGFGSFCSATQSDATDSTIGAEKHNNPALTADEETYVAELLAGLDAYPAYYVHMAPANTAGPTAPDLSLPAMAQPGRAPAPDRSRGMGGGPAPPHRLRRRPRSRHAELRHRRRLRHLPGLADRVGHPPHPARRDRGPGHQGPAGTGADRHRPARRRRDRRAAGLDRPAPRLVPAGHLRRPRPGPPPPRRRHPRRPPATRVRRRPDQRRGEHPPPRTAQARPRSPRRR